jgi:hypothetical protein
VEIVTDAFSEIIMILLFFGVPIGHMGGAIFVKKIQ